MQKTSDEIQQALLGMETQATFHMRHQIQQRKCFESWWANFDPRSCKYWEKQKSTTQGPKVRHHCGRPRRISYLPAMEWLGYKGLKNISLSPSPSIYLSIYLSPSFTRASLSLYSHDFGENSILLLSKLGFYDKEIQSLILKDKHQSMVFTIGNHMDY